MILTGLIYLMFFLSGAAALIYEVVWVRSLSLIFGGTHLAVTAVLSVFMGGLALGGFTIGKKVDTAKKPLRLYGFLEIGIAASAVAFILLMKLYPSAYIFLAQGRDGDRLYLSVIRILFACLALIVPTTLMGGTLPVLTRFVSNRASKTAAHLSFLYGLNTLGAVAGAAAAGFYLLRFYSVSITLHTAIAINFIIGIAAVFLQDPVSAMLDREGTGREVSDRERENFSQDMPAVAASRGNSFLERLVLIGIGVSGFCALGYEVLWTRVLTLTVGTSVYGFTIMLIAFLTGISLGSEMYGFFLRLLPPGKNTQNSRVFGFGLVQCIIGAAALLVTIHIRDLPVHAISLNAFYSSTGLNVFEARQWADLTLAFSYMLVPAFFMGLAFPLAGSIAADYRKKVGQAVGNVLAYNTIGAILGSAVSGFVLIYLLGIERSLQLLVVLNIGLGLLVMFSLKNRRIAVGLIGGLTLACIAFLSLNREALKVWDEKYFAIFRNNQPDAFDTPEKRRDALENTDVLFYLEGVNSTVSVIKIKGGNQALLVNGKVVASTTLGDRQVQLALGHLPMLLHKDPRKVLVVGLGTGMTLGAVSVHPDLESLTLAEIEPKVLGAARTFGKYNHNVLDNPKLHIVFNDGRNFLLTTKNKYDVITADPIHPWTQGSGYLYTSEYFKLASEHLRPGGIMCQWLPIYEMSVDNLKSVLRTFSLHFKYTMAWLTHFDVELIGSNSPIAIDEAALEKRISFPAISKDLAPVRMASATDFLSYFVMGTDGVKAFSKGGMINTDDNLYLEFSSPASTGINVMGRNLDAIAGYRESILPYLVPASGASRQAQIKTWETNARAALIDDRAHALFLGGKYNMPEFQSLMSELENKYPEYAPARFLRKAYLRELRKNPFLFEKAFFGLLDAQGKKTSVEISAVIAGVSEERAAVVFVDNDAKVIYGQKYFSGEDFEGRMHLFARDVMTAIRTTYQNQSRIAHDTGRSFPEAGPTTLLFKQVIAAKIKGDDSPSD